MAIYNEADLNLERRTWLGDMGSLTLTTVGRDVVQYVKRSSLWLTEAAPLTTIRHNPITQLCQAIC